MNAETLRYPSASSLDRRDVRNAIDQARTRGADVFATESKGLFSSSFALRLTGTPGQLLPTLRIFAALED